MTDVTRILSAIEGGDPKAAEQLLPLVYEGYLVAPWMPMVVLLGTIFMSGVGLAQQRDAAAETTRLFFRLVGADNNAPIIPKSRSAWTQDRQLRTETTGSADLGFTEYPFCSGVMDFTFVEGHAVYPRLVSHAAADRRVVNTADIVIDHVYQPDGCVWGWAGREFIQTFTATQTELVSVTLMVASEPGTFLASLVEGGPGGRQIGPAKPFVSGHSMTWGHARWLAGQAPLVPGRTYGIRIVRTDGKPWTPYLHSTGNAYDGGLLHVDGRPRPAADLAAWIVEQPPDLQRAIVHDTDDEGWAFHCSSVAFTPRTANVRLISLTLAPVIEHDMRDGYVDMVIRVRLDGQDGVLHRKRCLATGPRGGAQTAHFLFDSNEFPVEAGLPYRLDAYLIPHKQKTLPQAEPDRAPRDMRLRVYGEAAGEPLPAIYNLGVSYASNSGFQSDARVTFRWSASRPATTVIQTWGDGVNNGRETEISGGETSVEIPKFWPGHTYRFRLRATSPSGLVWRTPLYEIRIPRTTEVGPLTQEEYPEQFVTLAPPQVAAPPPSNVIRYRERVEVVNSDFEDGLSGWDASGDLPIEVSGSRQGLGVKWGRAVAGWFHDAGDSRKQALVKARLCQTIDTVPGHDYLLSAWGRTGVVDGPRGNTRLRLSADPTGGHDFGDDHCGPWYWTDGRWMRLEHRWRASGEQTTVALNLFRWWDVELATAHFDHVTVYDLGPVGLGANDPVIDHGKPPALALTGFSSEANDKVEAYLPTPPGTVITGIGSRAQDDNITTMWLRVQPLLADGTLGPPEQLRGGWEPDAGLEAQVLLPPTYVATGFGAGIAPEWDVKRLRVWGRPLSPDGSLGEEREFRGGSDLESGVERQVKVAPGRVLTSAGLNCMSNDVNGIRADSARLIRTSASRR